MRTYHGVSPGGAQMDRRRRSRSQFQPSEEGAEMPGRRRRSQIRASEEGDRVTRPTRRRRRHAVPETPDPLPDDQDTRQDDDGRPPARWESLPLDMLWEILLLLPPKPSSRLLASMVSRRWRGLATDPNFISQFRIHRKNWKPPMLGFFERRRKILFNQDVMHPPDRIPAERFHIPSSIACGRFEVLGCRGGRVLAIDREWGQLLVFAPITGEDHRVFVPHDFEPPAILNGAVLCTAGDQGHLHGPGHSSHFKIVLVSMFRSDNQPLVSVFSSETSMWSDTLTTKYPCELHGDAAPATLIGNSLYWLLSCNAIFGFDLDMQSIAVIMGPPGMNDSGNYRIIKPEDGADADGLAIAIFLFPNLQIWQRVVNSQGIATWFLGKTVEMHSTLGVPIQIRRKVWHDKVLGYDEDNNVIILYVGDSAYMLELKQMQSRKLNGTRSMKICHPFTSFYPPDISI